MSKAKGSTLLGAVKTLRKQRDEARAALPERLHRYLSDRILTASWYPEEDLLELIRAIVEISPGDRDSVLRAMGVATARALSEGVYSHLFEGSGSSTTTFALWSSMHDTGTLKSWKDRETGKVHFELRDFGHPSPEMCLITTGFIEESLRMSGRTLRMHHDGCVLSNAESCHWSAS